MAEQDPYAALDETTVWRPDKAAPEPEPGGPPDDGVPGDGAPDAFDLYECPVTPLGHRGGTYWFFSRVGELRELTSRELVSQAGLMSLFEGDTQWLSDRFPPEDKKGAGPFSIAYAGRWLIRQCAERGLFDSGAPVRGVGVWRDRMGRLVIHAGNEIRIGDDDWRRAGIVSDGVIYPSAPPVLQPAREPATAKDGKTLLTALRLWNFAPLTDATGQGVDLGAELHAGWIGQAMLGGAPSWRVHYMPVGGRGCGKSSLAVLTQSVLGAGAHPTSNNFTEAGLRQALTGEARALVLDESEHDEENSRVRAVIELLRHMAGGEGARVMRGSAGGRAQAFAVTGSAYLSSILHEPLQPQDRSRFLILRLLKPRDIGAEAAVLARDRVERATAWADRMSPAFRARAITGWPRFCATLAVYRAAFLDMGCDQRQSDVFGTLLAGRDLLIRDDIPDSEFAADEALRFHPLIDKAVIDEEGGEGDLCLNHLYTSTAELWQKGERIPVSRMILRAIDPRPAADRQGARQSLGNAGMRIEQTPEGPVLLVAKRHVGLDRIFAGTRWARGVWDQSLQYLPGAKPWPVPRRFAGVQQRAIMVPHHCLPREDDSPPDDPGDFDEATEMGP